MERKLLTSWDVFGPETRQRLARRVQIAKALAHPLRLLIVDELLVSCERCVCELAGTLGADVSTVSRHLTVLRLAGLVVDEKRGLKVYCRLRGREVEALLRTAEQTAGAIAREQARWAEVH